MKPKHYMCDPLKNTDCKKTFCKYNGDAVVRVCDRTSNPAFAMVDKLNRPMEAPEKSAEQFAREVHQLFQQSDSPCK